MPDTELDGPRLTKIYRKIRDAIAKNNAAHEQEDERLKADLKVVADLMLAHMGKDEGFKNQYGTVTRVIKSKYWSSDWGSMKKFCVEHADEGALDLMENRLAQRNMAEWIKQHPDKFPEGLQIDSRYDVQVVKPRSKPE